MMIRFLTLAALSWTLTATLPAAQELQDFGASASVWLNDYRASNDRSAVTVSSRLTQAAAVHARDMARRGFFSHQGSNGSSVADRARKEGYRYCFVAENIAKGQRDLGEVLQGWSRSKGHRRNMLSREVQEFALVRAPGNIWVMVMGRPGC